MKELFQSLLELDEKLRALLLLPPEELRTKFVEMFRGVAAERHERRRNRINMVYLLERLSDLDKDRDPPWGSMTVQKMIDSGHELLSADIKRTQGQEHESLEFNYMIEENRVGEFVRDTSKEFHAAFDFDKKDKIKQLQGSVRSMLSSADPATTKPLITTHNPRALRIIQDEQA